MRTNTTLPASEAIPESELSDLELLSQALQEAMDAHATGVIAGSPLDEVALRRSERRARRADANRLLNAQVPSEGAIA